MSGLMNWLLYPASLALLILTSNLLPDILWIGLLAAALAPLDRPRWRLALWLLPLSVCLLVSPFPERTILWSFCSPLGSAHNGLSGAIDFSTELINHLQPGPVSILLALALIVMRDPLKRLILKRINNRYFEPMASGTSLFAHRIADTIRQRLGRIGLILPIWIAALLSLGFPDWEKLSVLMALSILSSSSGMWAGFLFPLLVLEQPLFQCAGIIIALAAIWLLLVALERPVPIDQILLLHFIGYMVSGIVGFFALPFTAVIIRALSLSLAHAAAFEQPGRTS